MTGWWPESSEILSLLISGIWFCPLNPSSCHQDDHGCMECRVPLRAQSPCQSQEPLLCPNHCLAALSPQRSQILDIMGTWRWPWGVGSAACRVSQRAENPRPAGTQEPLFAKLPFLDDWLAARVPRDLKLGVSRVSGSARSIPAAATKMAVVARSVSLI